MSDELAPFFPPAPLLLASTSRYRAAQLQRLGLPFKMVDPPVDERAIIGPSPTATVIARARAKAEHSREIPGHPGAWIIGADQGVILHSGQDDERLLGKPGDAPSAIAQLMSLAGDEHLLLTAICLALPSGELLEEQSQMWITMWDFGEAEARAVVRRDASWDCAGAYKIEASGPLLMTKIQGEDPTAIEGLPLLALGRLIRHARTL